MPREVNQPGVPAPGQDYVRAVGLTPEERAEISIADVAEQKAAQIQHEHAGSAKDVASAIASALADLVGIANGGRKQISPAVLQARRQAWEDMEVLLEHYRENGEKPLYELTAPLFCDDVLIEASRTIKGPEGTANIATRIHFVDIPNEQMVPKNNSASKIHELYLKAIGGKTPDLGDTTYEAYLNRPRVAQVIGETPGVPMLGSPGTLRGSRATVLEDTPAEERRYVGPQKQMGTVQPEVHGTI
jgi:hypothetical protein